MIPAPGREKISKTREDVLSILPFSFCSFGSDVVSRRRGNAPAPRRITTCRAASGTWMAVIVHLHRAGKAAYLNR